MKHPGVVLDLPGGTLTSSDVAPKRKSTPVATVVFLAALSLVILAAYANTLFNFFLGDDFGLLVWVRAALNNPNLLWNDFHGSSLGSPTSRFYRPLISLSGVTDHLLYGTNATGYHLTNILYLIATSVCLYFIVRKLAGRELLAKAPLWPALCALLFGLYPLHSEVVAWIYGRVDGVVTAFYFGSVLAYLQWREKKSAVYISVSLICMALGLLAKEMAITVPAVIAAYEVIIGDDAGKNLFARLVTAIKQTIPYWIMLAGYMVLRWVSLGTFVGGYDDTSFFAADWGSVWSKWQQGLRFLLVPANRELMGSHNLLVILWQIWLVPCAVLLLTSLRVSAARSRVLFCLGWIAISLAPVYKLFTISETLQNSRYGYLASAPLCALLTLGLALLIHQRQDGGQVVHSLSTRSYSFGTIVAGLISVLFLGTAFLMLRANNSAWAYAGTSCNAIISQLRQFYDTTPGDPPVLLVNTPDSLHGAYICRNALEGMTQLPQLSRDIHNCSIINSFDREQPFGYLKSSLAQYGNKVRILAWNQAQQQLRQIALPSANPAKQVSLTGSQLADAAAPFRNTCTIAQENGSLVVNPTNNNKKAQVSLNLPQPWTCFSVDFIAIDLERIEVPSDAAEAPVDLSFTNEILDQFDSTDLIRSFLQPKTGKQTVLLSLRSHATWALGGQANRLMLSLPRGGAYRLIAIRSVPASEIMPSLSFPKSNLMGTRGVATFHSAKDSFPITYDASNIPGASGINLYLSKTNTTFEWPNSSDESSTILAHYSTPSGKFVLRRRQFPDHGLYELRTQAVNSRGDRLGVTSDHIVAFLEQ